MTLKTPSVLAFERKLDISDATFWQTNGKDKMPVLVQEKSVRGTISNRLKNAIASDPAKLDSEIQKANLQTVDASFLDESCDTLITRFTVKVLPFDGKANVCNEQAYQNALLDVVQAYKDEHGFDELARRYAYNIANARFLWRNRMGAESVSVVVTFGDESVEFANARELSLNNFDYQDDKLALLASWIKGGLMGDKFTILTVEAHAKVGFGQEVYPSQELILDTGSKKSKVLYRVGDISQNRAGMHSQKVSNAIRTIDDWYSDAQFPVATEPYGAVTTLGTAFRQPKEKQDFYSLFDGWVKDGKIPSENEQHYVMGVLIRGGVFGESGKE
ncbi:type I-F CRISPR-associated protein Csy3 [Moraxella sp. K127]|uniref:type I-F CRISPR-associated protein Csy3 n=1 Tax=Moraxella TaxID=475 RepID=UPI00187FF528|nr:type I-F CRISPR-associated protein Csy3 [Moraxella sp. K127]MBE9590102.1 type I-F CRISPR-associated protein Csy3 [Moraxella sp. K127]